MKKKLLAAAVSIGILAVPGLAAANLIGIEFNRSIWAIDPSTGAGSGLGSAVGSNVVNSAASDSSGTIWTATIRGPYDLVMIQPDGSSALGPALSQSIDITALAIDAADVAYAAAGVMFPANDDLVTIDLSDGTVTTVGSFGINNIQALAFAPDGTLYAWDTTLGLMTVDTSTGAATDVNSAVGGDFDVQALEFAPDGTLYGAKAELVTISTTTGERSVVGSGGYSDLRGLAYIPEPGTGLLLAAGLLALAARGRRVRF